MTSTDLKLRVDHSHAPFTVVAAIGELDGVGAPALRTKLSEVVDSGAGKVAVDLSDVAFIDSTGLGVLIQYHRLFAAEGGEMRVVVTQPHVRRVFGLTGLNEVLAVYDSLAAVLVV